MTQEEARLQEGREGTSNWKKWGSYLNERQWGIVREDDSKDGGAWNYFTHDQARSRAYHWGEDGTAGVSDDHQNLCFALERERSDPEREAVRIGERREQSCEGVLLLSGQRADAFLREISLQVPSGRIFL